MSGYDTYQYLIDYSLGNVKEIDFTIPSSHMQRADVLRFFETPENGEIIKQIEGIDFLENHPDIKFYQFNFKEGDYIQNTLNDSARIVFL